MTEFKNIKIDDYFYNLPKEKIAKFPLQIRHNSKLLIYKDKQISQDKFYNLQKYLPQNSLMVLNNTKVIFARLLFRKKTGAKIEIFCLNPYEPNDYQLAFTSKKSVKWIVLIGNLKKWKSDDLVLNTQINGKQISLFAKYIKPVSDGHIVEFYWDNEDFSFGEILDNLGQIPIPPYLERESVENDKQTYQTVYSKIKGSVAAPTAGLHFTDYVFDTLKNKNIKISEITLHVGAGTFKPVKSETIENHQMHKEFFAVSLQTLDDLLGNFNSIISVGTTSIRTLESLYWVGYKIFYDIKPYNFIDQWEVYSFDKQLDTKEALLTLKNYLLKNNLQNISGETKLIIVPSYKFRVVDVLLTNFHQPKSTLLLLVAAFVGDDWRRIYDYALENDFRFLSYGDSSVLFRKN